VVLLTARFGRFRVRRVVNTFVVLLTAHYGRFRVRRVVNTFVVLLTARFGCFWVRRVVNAFVVLLSARCGCFWVRQFVKIFVVLLTARFRCFRVRRVINTFGVFLTARFGCFQVCCVINAFVVLLTARFGCFWVRHLCRLMYLLFRVSTRSPNPHPFSICKPAATRHPHPSKTVPQHVGTGKLGLGCGLLWKTPGLPVPIPTRGAHVMAHWQGVVRIQSPDSGVIPAISCCLRRPFDTPTSLDEARGEVVGRASTLLSQFGWRSRSRLSAFCCASWRSFLGYFAFVVALQRG